jgi:Protein of unknown function DUF262
MSNSLFKYIPFQVLQVTAAIDQGTLALPDIQRPFVWPTTKVRDLLDSMYRGFPVGQVMFWQTGAEPGVRQIGIGGKSVPVPYHLIVDGQQRLTSLYAVTTGKPIVREDFTEARIKIAFNPFTQLFAVPDATTEKQVEWLADITPLCSRSSSTPLRATPSVWSRSEVTYHGRSAGTCSPSSTASTTFFTTSSRW